MDVETIRKYEEEISHTLIKMLLSFVIVSISSIFIFKTDFLLLKIKYDMVTLIVIFYLVWQTFLIICYFHYKYKRNNYRQDKNVKVIEMLYGKKQAQVEHTIYGFSCIEVMNVEVDENTVYPYIEYYAKNKVKNCTLHVSKT